MKKKISFKIYIKRVLEVAIVLTIVYFFTRMISTNWSQIKNYDWSFNYFYLTFSIFITTIAFLLQVYIWKSILEFVGYKASFDGVFRLFYISNMGRYIPGKVWSFLGVVYIGKKMLIHPRYTTATVVIGILTSLTACFLLSILLFFIYPIAGLEQYKLFAIPIFIALAVLVYPKFFKKVVNFFFKKGISNETVDYQFTLSHIIKTIGFYTINWLLFGLAFSFLVRSIIAIPSLIFVKTLSIFLISYLIGYLVLFVPGGIGVREGAMVVLLKQFMPVYLATGIAIFSRIIFSILEVIMFLVALRIKREK